MSGRVLDALDGRPLEGVTLTFSDERAVRSAADGTFTAELDIALAARRPQESGRRGRIPCRVEHAAYYPLDWVHLDADGALVLELLPRDETRLLASGAFTRVEVALAGTEPAPHDRRLHLSTRVGRARSLELAASAPATGAPWTKPLYGRLGHGWWLQALEDDGRGWSGVLPPPAALLDPRDVREHLASPRLPRTIVAEVSSRERGSFGTDEATVVRGGTTELRVTLEPTGTARIRLVDDCGGAELTDPPYRVWLHRGTELPVEARYEKGNGYVALDLAPGAWGITVAEQGVESEVDVRPARLHVSPGAEVEADVDVAVLRWIPVRVFGPDGRELAAPAAAWGVGPDGASSGEVAGLPFHRVEDDSTLRFEVSPPLLEHACGDRELRVVSMPVRGERGGEPRRAGFRLGLPRGAVVKLTATHEGADWGEASASVGWDAGGIELRFR